MPTKSEKPAKAEIAISEDEPRLETRNPKQAEIIAVNFESAGGVTAGLVTAHPKPAKRMNAKQRAQEKYKADAKDGITPDTKAKAKSKAEAKAQSKAQSKAQAKAKRKKSRAAG